MDKVMLKDMMGIYFKVQHFFTVRCFATQILGSSSGQLGYIYLGFTMKDLPWRVRIISITSEASLRVGLFHMWLKKNTDEISLGWDERNFPGQSSLNDVDFIATHASMINYRLNRLLMLSIMPLRTFKILDVQAASKSESLGVGFRPRVLMAFWNSQYVVEI